MYNLRRDYKEADAKEEGVLPTSGITSNPGRLQKTDEKARSAEVLGLSYPPLGLTCREYPGMVILYIVMI